MAREARAPWSLRQAERPGGSPLRLGSAAFAVLALLLVVLELLLGRLPVLGREPLAASDFRLALALIGLVSYLLGAFSAAVCGAERTLRELAPAFFDPALAAESLADVTGRRSSRRLARIGVFGAALFLLVPLATNLTPETWYLWRQSPEAIVHRLLLGPLGWLVARLTAVMWIESRRLAALGANALRIDLLDLRSLAPLARAGLRHTLIGAGQISFLLLAFLDDSVAPGLPFVLALGCAANLAFSAAALWLPLRGAHEAIVREKSAELERSTAQLRARAEAGAREAPGSLADALAWRRHVEAVPDWPLDLPTLRRFVLYLAIPLGSWLGGAVVDLLVERFAR
jgi:hypothetical protein